MPAAILVPEVAGAAVALGLLAFYPAIAGAVRPTRQPRAPQQITR